MIVIDNWFVRVKSPKLLGYLIKRNTELSIFRDELFFKIKGQRGRRRLHFLR